MLMHKSVDAACAAELFLQWVVWYYGMLQVIIVDHKPHFVLAEAVYKVRHHPPP